jgi:predicted anti-sigma-YlaC factor YlaD
MTCRKVRKLIPLAAGGDLRPRPAAALRAHVAACPACRAELESFREAMAGIRSVAKAEGVADWTESEWRSIMARAGAEAKRAGQAPVPKARPAFQPRWTAASALGALIGLAVLGVLFRGPSPRPAAMTAAGRALIAAGPAAQDKLTMTIVSPETGLQIVWILDRNFDWKGDRQ